MPLTIKVLLENRRAAGVDKSLKAKAGLSLRIQDETDAVLFDTGPMAVFCITQRKWASTSPE